MASYSSPYASDPFYENLRARARRRRAEEARGPTTNIVDTGVDTSGSDGPNVDVVGTNLTSALAPTTTIETPSARIEINDLDAVVGAAQPQYGVTKDYSTLLRISEGVSANTMPLLAAGVTESWSPIVQAAKSEALKVGIDQTPRYLRESETVGGLRTQVSGFQSDKSYLREPTGVYREVSDDELGDYPASAILSAREAAERNPLGYIGPDPTTPGGQLAKAGVGILNAFMPGTSLMTMMFGEVLETPAGTPYPTGSGLGKVVALNNYRTMWDTHGKMEAGIPGNFGMKIGNSYVTYQATDGLFGTGINGAKVVGRNINAEQFQKMYATQLGYDYRTVDFNNSKAGELNGERLQGFSDGVGGFSAATGEFVDSRGRTYTDLNRDQVEDYVNSLSYSPSQLAGALNALESKKETAKNSFFGAEYKQQTYQMAIDEVRGRMQEAEDLVAALSPEEYGLAIQQVQRQYGSRLTPEQIREQGLIVNVLESSLSPGATKWRTVVDPVTGKVNRYNFNLEPEPEVSTGPEVGTSVVGGTTYTTVSGGDGGGRDSSSPSSGRSSTSEAAASEDAYGPDPSDTYFAEGGRVRGATGMVAVDSPENEDQIGPVGFVNGRTPEETTEADTVRDDVEGAVPEGTFVINAVAVERYGSSKIRKLLLSALKEAEKQGIDISATDGTITDEDSVSVAVSEGEVLVPPALVRIIGLQKLESINALGQEEVKERVEEYGQAETSEPVEGEAPIQASVDGGFIERQKKAPGGLIQPLEIVTGKTGVIDDPEYLDKTFENAFKNMLKNRRALAEQVSQKERTGEPVMPFEELQETLQKIHQQYQDDMKAIKDVADPYVFQEYMRTHTDATADYYNAIEGFAERPEKSLLITDDYLGDLATMRVSIPIGAQDDGFIPTGHHYGMTFKESAAGDRAIGYTHGVRSNSTSPASTGFHEAGHISLEDKERANPLYRGINGAFVYRRKDEDGKIVEGVRLSEEEMMRVHDMFRSLALNNKDAYERSRNFIIRNSKSDFGNYLQTKDEKETQSVVYDIVYGALSNDYFGEHEVKQSFAKQRLPRPK